MDDGRIWTLLARKIANEATAEELKELELLLRSSPDKKEALTLMEGIKTEEGKDLSEQEKEQIIKRRINSIEDSFNEKGIFTEVKKVPFFFKYRAWIIAASVALLVGLGGYFYALNNSLTDGHQTAFLKDTSKVYVAKKATLIVLQDGTKVWLNQGSTLRCSNTFNQKMREVALSGEAFFKVAEDADKPFIVHAGSLINIKVLGTSFNVKAYHGDPFVETALVSGKVSVTIKNRKESPVILKPNEKLTLYGKQKKESKHNRQNQKVDVLKFQVKKMTPNPVDKSISELSWMEDKLSFNDITFEELSYRLERLYNVEITFENKEVAQYHLTGVFKDETIRDVLHALQITTPFKYTISGNKIIIHP